MNAIRIPRGASSVARLVRGGAWHRITTISADGARLEAACGFTFPATVAWASSAPAQVTCGHCVAAERRAIRQHHDLARLYAGVGERNSSRPPEAA